MTGHKISTQKRQFQAKVKVSTEKQHKRQSMRNLYERRFAVFFFRKVNDFPVFQLVKTYDDIVVPERSLTM